MQQNFSEKTTEFFWRKEQEKITETGFKDV
jgi:hypothetical protein